MKIRKVSCSEYNKKASDEVFHYAYAWLTTIEEVITMVKQDLAMN